MVNHTHIAPDPVPGGAILPPAATQRQCNSKGPRSGGIRKSLNPPATSFKLGAQTVQSKWRFDDYRPSKDSSLFDRINDAAPPLLHDGKC
ncbi:hypothetical protein D3C85_1139580 [compost metagenome]